MKIYLIPTSQLDVEELSRIFREIKEGESSSLAVRHLPGKHDQSKHGRKKLGSAYKPGIWRRATTAEQIEVSIANHKAALGPARFKKMTELHGDDFFKRLATMEVENRGSSRVYINGPHQIIFPTASGVPEKKQHQFLSDFDHFQSKYPSDHVMLIAIAQPEDMSAYGQTYINSGRMKLNPIIFDRGPENAANFMPRASDVPFPRYVLAHEWGHAVDNRELDDDGKALLTADISPYGGNNGHEGYAEAFAEWTLSGGLTSNEAAKAYAEEYGWAKRWP